MRKINFIQYLKYIFPFICFILIFCFFGNSTTLAQASSEEPSYVITDFEGSIDNIDDVFVLSWNCDSLYYSYTIYYSDSLDGEYTKCYSSYATDTYCEVTMYDVKRGVPYFYKLQTENGATCYTDLLKLELDTPVIDSVTAYDNRILDVAWDGVSGASGYDIYRSESMDGIYEKMGTRTSDTLNYYYDYYYDYDYDSYSFAQKDLKLNCTYYYKVVPYVTFNNIDYYGNYSAPSYSTVSKDYVIPKISDLKAESNENCADISWTANVTSYSYDVLYSTSKNGTYKIAYSGKCSEDSDWDFDYTDYTDSTDYTCGYSYYDMIQGVPYYFQVVINSISTYTVDSEGKLSCATIEKGSKAVKTQKLLYSLDKPEVSIANVDSQGISLTWSPVSNASGYFIYRSTSKNGTYKKVYTQKKKKKETRKEKYSYYDYNEKTGEFEKKYGYNEVSIEYKYTETNLNLGSTYYYKVIPYFIYQNTKYKNQASDILNKQVTLNNIYIMKAKSTKPNTNTITWNKIPKAEGYTVYYSKSSSGKFKKLKDFKGNSKTSFVHKKLKNGQAYYYKIVAFKTVKGKKVKSSTEVYEKYCDYYGYEYESYYSKAMRIQGKPEITQYPSNKSAQKHMETFTIKVWDLDANGKYYTRTFYLTMHKNIAPTVKQIFKEIYKSKQKTPIHSIGGFNYSGTWNEHMLGLAIDVNPNENAMFDDGVAVVGSFFDPKKSPYSIADDSDFVKIMNKYGFYRGKWGTRLDYMHFSFFGT